MDKGYCGGCAFEDWTGEYGTIQSCVKDEVTFRDEGIEIGDNLYSWGQCPLWEDAPVDKMPRIPF